MGIIQVNDLSENNSTQSSSMRAERRGKVPWERPAKSYIDILETNSAAKRVIFPTLVENRAW